MYVIWFTYANITESVFTTRFVLYKDNLVPGSLRNSVQNGVLRKRRHLRFTLQVTTGNEVGKIWKYGKNVMIIPQEIRKFSLILTSPVFLWVRAFLFQHSEVKTERINKKKCIFVLTKPFNWFLYYFEIMINSSFIGAIFPVYFIFFCI